MKKLVAGILAHVDAGKTTLSEGILYVSGAIRRQGRVDHKDAFLDTYALERERGITIFSKQAEIALPKVRVTLLDTPGHVDFSAEMERTLQVLDYAILVLSGADGVQGHTRTLWRLLEQYQIPTFLFVNKMDQAGTDKEKLFAEIKRELSENCVVFSEKMADLQGFCEAVATCDEELLEDFLETDALEYDKVRALIAERKLFPCYFGSALKLTGVQDFLNDFAFYTQEMEYPPEFGARVYKIARDEQGNRLTYLKVTGGNLAVKSMIGEEKINQIRIYSGVKFEMTDIAEAGIVCAVTGLTQTYVGEGLGIEEDSKKPMLEPVLSYRVELPEGCDARLVLPKLKELEEEIPELHVIWEDTLKDILVQMMGEVQIEILQSIIEERFGIKAGFSAGRILYKETIENTVEGVGHYEPLKHYAEVHLILEPGERGSGLQFVTDCREEILDKNWQRLILTHASEGKST